MTRPPLPLTACLFLAAVVGAAGCGHATRVRPVQKGAVALRAELGGPLGRVEGNLIPLPLATVGAGYGMGPRWDLEGNVHLTTALFGVAGLDVGSTVLLLEPNGARPALAATARLHGFTNFEDFRAWAELTPSVSWDLGERVIPYASGTVLAQFAGGPPLFAVGGGAVVRLGKSSLQLEARWYQPGYESRNLPAAWVGVGGQGAFGFVVGYQLQLGGAAR